jgi:hypothetical protein
VSHPRECDASIARVGIKIFEVKRRKKEELCKFENLKLRALAGRSLSVFLSLSLSIQAVAYLPVEYSSGARNGDRCGKEV